MKKGKKIISKIIIITVIILLQFLVFYNSVLATTIDKANVYMIGDCGTLLKYKGVPVKVSYVQYTNDGMDYPAYCLDKTKPGAENGEYTVSVSEMIQDIGLWRRVSNGYPYKTIEELGVANKEEAFTATKQAIYCYVHGNNPADYTPIGEAGERTLRAMNQIIMQAENSSEIKIANTLKVSEETTKWEQDTNDKDYISKTFSVSANVQIQNYFVNIHGNNIEEIVITDLQNQAKNEFHSNEKFKILLPIKKLKESGEFNIIVEAKVKTKPVLYGTAPNSNLQDYALTAAIYEDGIGELQQKYSKNETEIVVIKQDEETREKIDNVEFILLNDKMEEIMQGLITDEDGMIKISNLLPGKYYLKEVYTPDGYLNAEELINIEISWNENLTVYVYNKKENKPEIQIDKKEETKVIKKLPTTGM